jgi:hypothetical protein
MVMWPAGMISVFSNYANSVKEVLLEKLVVALLLKKLPAFEGNILPWTQPVIATPLIWQHVSTSGGHLQASVIKYIKGIVCNFIKC